MKKDKLIFPDSVRYYSDNVFVALMIYFIIAFSILFLLQAFIK